MNEVKQMSSYNNEKRIGNEFNKGIESLPQIQIF